MLCDKRSVFDSFVCTSKYFITLLYSIRSFTQVHQILQLFTSLDSLIVFDSNVPDKRVQSAYRDAKHQSRGFNAAEGCSILRVFERQYNVKSILYTFTITSGGGTMIHYSYIITVVFCCSHFTVLIYGKVFFKCIFCKL